MSVTGQSVIVTGSAKGIGRFIAGTFVAAGAKVALADIDSERLDQTGRELTDRGGDVLALRVDVSNEDDVIRMCDQVVDRWGQLDVLVNNAGIVPHFMWGLPLWSPIREMDQAFWNRVIQTNLGGTFLGTKHALRHMRPRRSGHIINLYGGGDLKRGGSCAYVVSKDAIRTFTRYVAEEERGAGICIVAMNPGATIATEDAPQEARQRMPGPDVVGDRFVLAAEAPLEFAGQLLTVKDGKLAIRDDR